MLAEKTAYNFSCLSSQSVSDSQSLHPLWPLARAASPRDMLCCVEHALRACSTQHNMSGVMWTRRLAPGPHHTLNQASAAGANQRSGWKPGRLTARAIISVDR